MEAEKPVLLPLPRLCTGQLERKQAHAAAEGIEVT